MRYIIFVALLLLLISCDQSTTLNEECLGEVNSGEALYCSDVEVGDKYCDVRYAGKQKLTEQAKSIFELFCMDIGESLEFVNTDGEILTFAVNEKSYVEIHDFIDQGPCPNDDSKAILDCIDHEIATVHLISSVYDFKISIKTLTDQQANNEVNIGDFLTIDRWVAGDLYYENFKIVLDRRSLSYEQEACLTFYENVTLNNKAFENVYGKDILGNCSNGNYYYSLEEGLIAFDFTGEDLWVINQ